MPEKWNDTKITEAIIHAYHEKFVSRITSDVLIVGAGPAGLTAATYLSREGFKVTVLEKRLSPGGGIWGGGMGLNELVIQEKAIPILQEFGIRSGKSKGGLRTVDAVELASSLCVGALRAGAVILNLVTLEDVCVHKKRLVGLVVNRTMISGNLHVDPVTLSGNAVIDATGHDAVVVGCLRRQGLLSLSSSRETLREGPMNAAEGEVFVVEKTSEIFPCLWVAGMSVAVTFGGPRMGPIFGGMLLSGRKVAAGIAAKLKKRSG